MKVLLLTRYGRLGASSRLRAYQYLPYLESHGTHITAAPLFGDYYQLDMAAERSRRWSRIAAAYLSRVLHVARSRAFDLVWIEYELFPWLPALAERALARLGVPYLVDYDDAIYHRYELHSNPLVRRLLGKKIDVIMRRATTVVVGNDYLGARARAAGARTIAHLPTVIDLAHYPVLPPTGGRPFTIGWIGSPSTARYLTPLRSVLARFCASHDARLLIVGAGNVTLGDLPVAAKAWSEATEVADLQGFDVGIMPLPDEPWERGKCGYKLIQYMASQRPVVASPVGVNRDLVEPGVNGFLASSETEWQVALEELYAAPELRTRLGAAGRDKVEAHYCTRVTAPQLATLLDQAASNGPAR